MCHNLFRFSQLERDHVSRDLNILFLLSSHSYDHWNPSLFMAQKPHCDFLPPLAFVSTIEKSQNYHVQPKRSPTSGPQMLLSVPPTGPQQIIEPFIRQAATGHVTTKVCTEPRIIRPTQPMGKSLSESAQSLNIDALLPAPIASPKPAQRLFAGGVPTSNHCRQRCANQRRNRPAIGPCRCSPAGMSLPQSAAS
jgi:hypothetical protein